MEQTIWKFFGAALPEDENSTDCVPNVTEHLTTESETNQKEELGKVPEAPPMPPTNFQQDFKRRLFLKSKKSIDPTFDDGQNFVGMDSIVEELKRKGVSQLRKIPQEKKSIGDNEKVIGITRISPGNDAKQNIVSSELDVIFKSKRNFHDRSIPEKLSASDTQKKPKGIYGSRELHLKDVDLPLIQKSKIPAPNSNAYTQKQKNEIPVATIENEIQSAAMDKQDILSSSESHKPTNQMDSEESEETDVEEIDIEIEMKEFELKKSKIGKENMDEDESYLELEIQLRQLKLKRSKLTKRNKKKKYLKEKAKIENKHKEGGEKCLANENMPKLSKLNYSERPENSSTQEPLNKNNTNPNKELINCNAIKTQLAKAEIANPSESTKIRITVNKQKPPIVKENPSDELMKKLQRRKTMIETGEETIHSNIFNTQDNNPEKLIKPYECEYKTVTRISEKEKMPENSVNDKNEDKMEANNKSSLSQKPEPFLKGNIFDEVVIKTSLKEIPSLILTSEMENNFIPIPEIPIPPPIPATIYTLEKISLGKKLDEVKNCEPSDANSIPLTSKEHEMIDSHASLMREIVTGIKLRSVKTQDSKHLKFGTGRRATQDLESILKTAVNLRNEVMNPDTDSDDSGNDEDWEDELEMTTSYPLMSEE